MQAEVFRVSGHAQDTYLEPNIREMEAKTLTQFMSITVYLMILPWNPWNSAGVSRCLMHSSGVWRLIKAPKVYRLDLCHVLLPL